MNKEFVKIPISSYFSQWHEEMIFSTISNDFVIFGSLYQTYFTEKKKNNIILKIVYQRKKIRYSSPTKRLRGFTPGYILYILRLAASGCMEDFLKMTCKS